MFFCWFELFEEVLGWVQILSKIENFDYQGISESEISEISQVRNDNDQKVVKIWNFAKHCSHEKFQFLTKFWLNLKLSEMIENNKKKL